MIRRRYLLIIVAIIIVVVIVAFAYFSSTPKFVREEELGGKYNAKLFVLGNYTLASGNYIQVFEYGYIVYMKDGVEHKGNYESYLLDALNWIKANTPSDSIFLCWWDYGHMIVGYAERESVIKNPSVEALKSVAEPYRSEVKEFDPHEMIVNVATALTTTNESLTRQIMKMYGAEYILITTEDAAGKAWWIFHFAGLNASDYLYASHSAFNPQDYTELGKKIMIYKLFTNSDLQFFTQVYSDTNVKIFKIIN